MARPPCWLAAPWPPALPGALPTALNQMVCCQWPFARAGLAAAAACAGQAAGVAGQQGPGWRRGCRPRARRARCPQDSEHRGAVARAVHSGGNLPHRVHPLQPAAGARWAAVTCRWRCCWLFRGSRLRRRAASCAAPAGADPRPRSDVPARGDTLSLLALLLLSRPGMCFFFGGLKYKEQRFSTLANKVSSCLLFLACIGIIIPSTAKIIYGGEVITSGPPSARLPLPPPPCRPRLPLTPTQPRRRAAGRAACHGRRVGPPAERCLAPRPASPAAEDVLFNLSHAIAIVLIFM